MSSSVFIPLTVSFNAIPCKPSIAARLSDTQELPQAVSHKTNAVVLLPEKLVKFSSAIWRRPLTSVTDDKVVVVLGCSWPLAGLLVPPFDFEVLMLLFVEALDGKAFSAPWSEMLWKLLQPSFLPLRGLLHCLNLCLSSNQDKQSSLRVVFSLKTRHSHNRWLPWHTMQLKIDVDGEHCCCLRLLLCCVFAANAFEETFFLVTGLLLSSVLALVAVIFF